MDVFVPTPTPESHSLLEVYALQHGFYTRSMDIVAAFLIGADRGAAEGNHVYMRAPPAWEDVFHEWLSGLAPPDQARLRYRFKDLFSAWTATYTAEEQPGPSTETSWRRF